MAYGALNRPLQQQYTVPGTGGGIFRLDTTYTTAGQRATLRYPGGNAGQQGEIVAFGYNTVGQLNSVTSDDGTQYIASTTYNAQGQVTEQRLDSGANGFTRQSVYNANTLRLETLKAGTAAPFENLQKLAYAYDLAGNVQTLTDTANSGQVQTFGYDWLDRLTTAATNAAGVGQYSHTYAYNAIGNLTSYNGNSYAYGSQPHAVIAAFGNSYGYDPVGNQTSRTIAGTAYTQSFDYDNRLLGVAGGSVNATFLYDAEGNRVKGTVAGITTVYISGLYEYQNGATTKYYEGGALRRTGYASDNGVFYTLSDQLRSTSVLVNQNGTVKDRNYYYPYGGNRGGSAFSGITTKRFTGQYHEQRLPGGEGLAFYNARWYDSQVGVFVSADTLVPSPLAPQTLNRYAYVSGNPLRYTDPTGHMQREDEGGGGGRSKPKPPTYGVWRPPVQKTWTWPRIPVPSNWLWPNGRFNAVAYTLFEMRKNIASAKATEIRSLNHKANATSHALAGAARKTLANAEWGSMVAPNRPWDHKTKITAITKSLEPVNKTGGWQQVGGEEYRFDTWSNVHYGYVGRSVGFSAEWLQTAASLAQFGDDLRHRKPSQYNPENGGFLNRFDDIPDQAAIALGAKLWDDYGTNGAVPTQEQFIQALQVAPGMERRPDQGGQP